MVACTSRDLKNTLRVFHVRRNRNRMRSSRSGGVAGGVVGGGGGGEDDAAVTTTRAVELSSYGPPVSHDYSPVLIENRSVAGVGGHLEILRKATEDALAPVVTVGVSFFVSIGSAILFPSIA
jgi:hypothetical protein